MLLNRNGIKMIWTRMLLNKSLVTRALLGALLLAGLSERISADTISLSPGDTLSSSVLNDLLEPIQAPIDYQDFLGAWQVSQYICLGGTISADLEGLCESDVELNEAVQPGGSHFERQDVWQIQLLDREDFPLIIQSQKLNFLFNPVLSYIAPNDPITWQCDLSAGRFLTCIGPENIQYGATNGCQHEECLIHVIMRVDRLTTNNLRLSLGPIDTRLTGGSANLLGLFNEVILRKDKILPTPRLVSAYSQDSGVDLEWTAAEDFSGFFNVFRKDELYGDFESLGVVSDQNFNDASVEPGKYWYRIYSESDGELSLGSNVRSVLVD